MARLQAQRLSHADRLSRDRGLARLGPRPARRNVSPVRGTKLVHERGNGPVIRCGWHRSYDLDGSLKGTPIIGGHRINSVDGIDHSQLGLLRVCTDEWLDVVFVRVAAEGRSLDAHLAPLKARLAPYGVDRYRTDVPAENGERVVDINLKPLSRRRARGISHPLVHPALEQPSATPQPSARPASWIPRHG